MDNSTSQDSKKKCPLCAEMVQQEAKVCRYCRHWFSKNPLDPHNPRFFVTIIVVIFLLNLLVQEYFSSKLESTIDENFKVFEAGSSGLKILKKKVLKNNDRIKIAGLIENTGEDIWKGITLEVHLKDEDGLVIAILKDYISGAIKPGETRPFLFEQKCGKEKETYNFSSYSISISNAYYATPKNQEK